MKTGCIVLAGGAGTRMKSNRPKVLAEVLCKPMLGWVLDACSGFGFDGIAVVTGYKAELTEEYVASRGETIITYLQKDQKGTGDAVKSAEEMINAMDCVCVLNGDAPFIDAATLKSSFEYHKECGADVTVITADIPEPQGYGRIIRTNGEFTAIREQKDCSPEEAKISEVNSGAYWFNAEKLLKMLPRLSTNNAAGEYYLTDCVEIAAKRAAFKSENPKIVLGANTRKALYELNTIARESIIEKHMENGVSFVDTSGIIIGTDVEIGCDTVVMPNTIILGKTTIGEGCYIGANCHIEDCTIGDTVYIDNSQAYGSTIETYVWVGPFAQLRPGTILRTGVKIGDFVEVKNSDIGMNTCAAHLTYIGDSDVGQGVNFGCGTITCNYDGINKFRTKIGDHAFIGSNTNLIAPVEIGENAATAAGSTITKNVPANALAVERGTTRIKENWEKNLRRPKKQFHGKK